MVSRGKQPLDEFTRAGDIGITAAALNLAREFAEDIGRSAVGGEWVTTFDWVYSRQVRQRPGGPWEDIGAGLDLGAHKRREVPPEAIQIVAGVEFAVKVPRDVYAKSRERLIDRDDTAFSKLVLR